MYKTHGSGKFKRKEFGKIGKNVTIEPGVLVMDAKNIEIGNNVYIGHNTILHGYHNNKIKIGDNSFISAGCILYGSGGLTIGCQVGIGPRVTMLGSPHDLSKDDLGPINKLPMKFEPIVIEEGCDIGMGALILGGVTVRRGTQVGAGAVVTKSTKPNSIVAGVPAKMLRMRKKAPKINHAKKK